MNNTKMQSMMETVKNIFEASQSALESMAVGDRVQIKELARTVALAVATDPKHVLDFVNYFAHNTDIAYVTRGKNGGIIRGTRQAKVTKPKPKAQSKVAADSAQAVDSASV